MDKFIKAAVYKNGVTSIRDVIGGTYAFHRHCKLGCTE